MLTLNPDSTEEFRATYDGHLPEFGLNSSAVIDIITRSGTNSFHGDLDDFGRWNALARKRYVEHRNARTGAAEPLRAQYLWSFHRWAKLSITRFSFSSITKAIASTTATTSVATVP